MGHEKSGELCPKSENEKSGEPLPDSGALKNAGWHRCPAFLKMRERDRMAKLRLYHIREGYVEFLHKADNRVQMNKGERRPYVGIVLTIGDFDYYVPLESPKPNHANIKSGGPVFKLDNGALGIMGFNNMIPVKKYHIIDFDIQAIPDVKYRTLLLKQLAYCEKNRDLIQARAATTYRKATDGKNPFYRRICCDFKRLERISGTYKVKKTNR